MATKRPTKKRKDLAPKSGNVKGGKLATNDNMTLFAPRSRRRNSEICRRGRTSRAGRRPRKPSNPQPVRRTR